MTNTESTPFSFDDDQYDPELVEREINDIIGSTASNRAPGLEIAQNTSQETAFTQDGEEYDPETGHFIDKEVHEHALTAMAHMAVKDYRVVAEYGQGSDIEPVLSGQAPDSMSVAHDTDHPVAS